MHLHTTVPTLVVARGGLWVRVDEFLAGTQARDPVPPLPRLVLKKALKLSPHDSDSPNVTARLLHEPGVYTLFTQDQAEGCQKREKFLRPLEGLARRPVASPECLSTCSRLAWRG